ncbi:MAG: hypothetical protein KJ646_04370, partial [Nanoarchaeota archaeon]|nr:hypothetical protein [Nanoarchaeota archaeon]MBU4116877.1 hypothetical protein [Nanoarchaeota archaeon]
ENGESWCVYDGYIGDGKDVPGSRHWKRMCIEGKVKYEPCADYRGQICAQTIIEQDDRDFSMASCIVNEAFMCIAANGGEEGCEGNKHCIMKNIFVDKYFQFEQCVPNYPRGFDLQDASIASSLCSIASRTCTIYYEKDWLGNWKCKENCNCKTEIFTSQLEDFCTSLGDCGSSVNYLYSEPVKGQYAEPKDMAEFLAKVLREQGEYGQGAEENQISQEEKNAKTIQTFGTVTGALGGTVAVLGWAFGTTTAIITIPSVAGAAPLVAGGSATSGMFGSGLIGPGLAAFGIAAAAFAIGAIAGFYIGKSLGFQGYGLMMFALGMGIALASISLMVFTTICGTTGWWSLGIGCIIGVIVGVVIMLWGAFSGWGQTRKERVSFECYAWQAPVGGEDCSKCNDDVLKPCSKYRCESLGQACVLLNEDEENPICEAIKYETNPPVISAGDVMNLDYEFFNEKSKSVEIRKDTGECIPEFTPVLFTLNTDEPAQCRFDLEQKQNYEEFANYPLGGSVFAEEHSFAFMMPSLDSFGIYNITGDLKEMFGNINYYVKCIDYHGNYNLDVYNINFCINTGPDMTSPIITYSEPRNYAFLKYNLTETPLAIYLNEPAECKYDIADKDYNNMLNEMNCKTEIDDAELYGWECNTTLVNLINDSNTIYIKCKDQPWKPAEEDKLRNINQESYTFTLQKTKYALSIDSISPQGEIEEGFEPISINLEVKTSGGASYSVCYYSFLGIESMFPFYENSFEYHEQKFDMMIQGNYRIYVKCEDDVGNIDYANASFSLNLDTSAPVVVRAYNEASKLKLITDEPAECYYDLNKCNFNFDNAKSMTIALSTEHTANWNDGQKYHVKCRDSWGNTNSNCAIVVKL